MVCIKTIKVFIYHFRKNLGKILYCLIIVFLSLRGILETSYAVFSIDLIIFVLALSFISNEKVKINNIKFKFLK